MLARAHRNRLALKLGSDFDLIRLIGKRRGRSKKHGRRRPDQHCGFKILAAALRDLMVHRQVMARRKPTTQLLVADEHRAMKRQVLYAGIRGLRQKHRRGEIRRAVTLRIGNERQITQLAIEIFNVV
jgi:transposase